MRNCLTSEFLKDLDLNEEFVRAYHLLESTKKNVFITGKAGTGKSTLLQYFRKQTNKNIAVLAPTGVAAVNVKGQTIHSFFRFKPDITPDSVHLIKIYKKQRQLYQNLEVIVIDEVSMVRADLLDCVDAFLRRFGKKKKAPFGGVQMIFMGDLYQLPPVVPQGERDIFEEVYASPYFFDAKVFDSVDLQFLELERIYRQKDDRFIKLLNAIRNNSADDKQVAALNRRYVPDFQPSKNDFYVYLTTTNSLADKINQEQLNKTKGKSFFYDGIISEKFNLRAFPTQASLELKKGAQVMLLNNDPSGRWINGSIGKVVNLLGKGDFTDIVVVELSDGSVVEVSPFTWEMYKFSFNEDTQALESTSVGSFTQFPLRLAWAVTIHKGQGKTFSKIIIDIGTGTFAHGQIYVALSRCTTLEGIVLKRPISKRHIFMDERIVNFMANW